MCDVPAPTCNDRSTLSQLAVLAAAPVDRAASTRPFPIELLLAGNAALYTGNGPAAGLRNRFAAVKALAARLAPR
jgi:hypothetical protein